MRGITLLELIVSLALIGLLIGVIGLSLASLQPSRESEVVSRKARARTAAIQTGQAVRVDSVLFLPDGRAIGASLDPLTGATRATR